jgi:hypothetical protein
MSLRILHVLDHSIPLHSGYTFRTLSILREQRALGWETFHLTSLKHAAPSAPEEHVDGLHFSDAVATGAPGTDTGLRELALMRATERRLEEIAREVRPTSCTLTRPCSMRCLHCASAGGLAPVVYEGARRRTLPDHGTARAGGLRYRPPHGSRRLHGGGRPGHHDLQRT